MLTNAPVTTAAEARALIAELGRRFYALGWASGTGGGISLRLGDRVFMAPSGIQKEAIDEASIYELDQAGNVTGAHPRRAASRCLSAGPCSSTPSRSATRAP